MKVYVYGTIVPGALNRRVREFESVTTSQFQAFLDCYITGLDGNDYFMVEYDTELDKKRYVSMLDKQYGDLYDQVIQHVKREESWKALSRTILRAEDV